MKDKNLITETDILHFMDENNIDSVKHMLHLTKAMSNNDMKEAAKLLENESRQSIVNLHSSIRERYRELKKEERKDSNGFFKVLNAQVNEKYKLKTSIYERNLVNDLLTARILFKMMLSNEKVFKERGRIMNIKTDEHYVNITKALAFGVKRSSDSVFVIGISDRKGRIPGNVKNVDFTFNPNSEKEFVSAHKSAMNLIWYITGVKEEDMQRLIPMQEHQQAEATKVF